MLEALERYDASPRDECDTAKSGDWRRAGRVKAVPENCSAYSPKGTALRGVAASRQRSRQRLAGEFVAEAAHVSIGFGEPVRSQASFYDTARRRSFTPIGHDALLGGVAAVGRAPASADAPGHVRRFHNVLAGGARHRGEGSRNPAAAARRGLAATTLSAARVGVAKMMPAIPQKQPPSHNARNTSIGFNCRRRPTSSGCTNCPSIVAISQVCSRPPQWHDPSRRRK